MNHLKVRGMQAILQYASAGRAVPASVGLAFVVLLR
jgi:hypothetical protein